MKDSVRSCAVAGTFYSKDKNRLWTELKEFFEKAACEVGKLSAASNFLAGHNLVFSHMIMLPHAGHVYCGDVVAQTLLQVELPPTLVLLCPNHTGQGHPLGLWAKGAWESPLGRVEIDEELAALLLEAQVFYEDKASHLHEHSLEVLVPFFQYLGKARGQTFRIVPVSVSIQGQALVAAGEKLAQVLHQYNAAGHGATIVVSSDMNHYADHETTLAVDNLALEQLLALNPVGLYEVVVQNKISMCGIFPATLGLVAALRMGAQKAQLTAHTTSAQISGDASRAVGYAGVILS